MVAALLGFTACRKVPATYPGARLAEALIQVCKKDYGLNLGAKRAGSTLMAFTWIDTLFDENGMLTREASEVIEKVQLSGTRVVLSTDAKVDFLQVQAGNPRTGSKITLIRYVKDIKDSLYTRISQEEYYNRLVVEMDPFARDFGTSTGEAHWEPPLTMPIFLAKQIQSRLRKLEPDVAIQTILQENDHALDFLVYDQGADISAEKYSKVAKSCEKVSRGVIQAYGFRGFQEARMLTSAGSLVGRWKL